MRALPTNVVFAAQSWGGFATGNLGFGILDEKGRERGAKLFLSLTDHKDVHGAPLFRAIFQATRAGQDYQSSKYVWSGVRNDDYSTWFFADVEAGKAALLKTLEGAFKRLAKKYPEVK